ncbi:MAG: NUDIX hydrolase [Rhizobiaceae bacterium]
MSGRLYPNTPLLGACTAIWRGDRVLLALRSRAPNADKWAMPGGMVEAGETLAQAAIREVREETQLVIENPIFNRFHEIIRHDAENRIELHIVLAMFAARHEHGADAVAGDDAADVGWYTLEDAARLPLTPQTEIFLRESLDLLAAPV